jgi:hypothetical protein
MGSLRGAARCGRGQGGIRLAGGILAGAMRGSGFCEMRIRRPVLAEKVREGVYRILQQEYDREIETWEFSLGTVGLCEARSGDSSMILAAIAAV